MLTSAKELPTWKTARVLLPDKETTSASLAPIAAESRAIFVARTERWGNRNLRFFSSGANFYTPSLESFPNAEVTIIDTVDWREWVRLSLRYWTLFTRRTSFWRLRRKTLPQPKR